MKPNWAALAAAALIVGAAGSQFGLGSALFPAPAHAASSVTIAAPAYDPPVTASRATAVLAGGCFWGTEAVFSRLKGVTSVVSGYAGGSAASATYELVSSEKTGHAEAIRITYDPRVISYGTLLQVFFSVAHDPTQLNRQGPDTGPSYRSAIFPQDQAQTEVARRYIAQLGAAKVFPKPIVTRLEQGRFYTAEAYHQDFMAKNPRHGYIVMFDVPKVNALKARFPNLWRTPPVS